MYLLFLIFNMDSQSGCQMPKVIRVCFGFCFTTLCDWLAKLAPFSQPMRSKTKTNLTCLHAFSRALRWLREFALNSDWFVALFDLL